MTRPERHLIAATPRSASGWSWQPRRACTGRRRPRREWGVGFNDEDLCTTLTKNFIKACQNAVKDSVKCIDKQINTLSKQNQTLCKAFDEGSDCVDSYKDDAKGDSDEVGDIGDSESGFCETEAAEIFFDICMFGF